ncbi:MAG: LysM peptidoglycan-binding domain-containing protein [Candidatus Moraniibacteriota bacterium]|nr:MAG: LysM peptidoglycan-binding domain-containing protein [Candidatus Moranbacteria bacterium]
MMFRKLLVIAGIFLAVVGAPLASAGTYTVVKGDSLIKIANKSQTSWQEIARANGIKAPHTIRVGQTLTLPESGIVVSSVKQSPVVLESSSGIRQWKKVGADSLLPLRLRKEWHKTEELQLTSEQSRRLSQFGLSSSEVEQVRGDLVSGKCQAVARPIGFTWEGMAMGKGNWGKTQNASGTDIMVWACPSMNGSKQVDIAMRCGNVAWNTVTVPTPPAPAPTQESLGCEAVGALWAQMGQRGESGSLRFSCLFPVGNGWKVGPSIAGKSARFNNKEWVEVSDFYGVGIEGRGPVGDIDAVEFVVLAGQGSTRGYSKDGLVEKLRADGMDLRIALQLRERFKIDDQTGVTVRFMPWVDIPLSGNKTDILWKGTPVNHESARKLVVGAILRFELDRADWNVKPELTLGIWHISDVVSNPIGGKILAGIATKDDVWRIGVGVQFPDPHFIVEIEWNAGLGWLRANSQVATTALTDNAGSSQQYLGVKAKAVAPKAKSVPSSQSDENHFVKDYKADQHNNTSTSSPFGWAADQQTASSNNEEKQHITISSSGGIESALGSFSG